MTILAWDAGRGTGRQRFGWRLIRHRMPPGLGDRRDAGAEIGVALGVAAAYLSVFVQMAIPTERFWNGRARVAASPYLLCSRS